jgi:hypothetical protein
MNHFPGHFRLNPMSAPPQQQKRTQPQISTFSCKFRMKFHKTGEQISLRSQLSRLPTCGTDAGNTVRQSCLIHAGATSHTITITHNFGFATGAPNALSMDGSHALAVARQNRTSGSGGNPDEAVIVMEEILEGESDVVVDQLALRLIFHR